MSDPALAFISSTICLVRLIIVSACISGFAVVSAQAGDRWPQNVCNEISSMESDTEEFVQFDPAYRALMRAKLIPLLKYHCGVDTRAKERIDDAAIDAWVKKDDSKARRRAAVPRPPSWGETTPAPRKAAPVETAEPAYGPLNCTIRNLGGDGQLSTMSCPSGPTNCIIRNLGDDGQLSTMSCP